MLPRRRGRPTKAEVAARQHQERQVGATMMEAGSDIEVRRGVSVQWLTNVFGIRRETVKRRLIPARPSGLAPSGDPIYDLRDVAALVVEPKVDLDKILADLDPKNLPLEINKVYWAGKRERLRYLAEAGEVWHTGDVLDLLGQVFMTIKHQTRLWVETMRDTAQLSDDQMRRLQEMVDSYQNELHEKLCEIPRKRRTLPLSGEGETAEPQRDPILDDLL